MYSAQNAQGRHHDVRDSAGIRPVGAESTRSGSGTPMWKVSVLLEYFRGVALARGGLKEREISLTEIVPLRLANVAPISSELLRETGMADQEFCDPQSDAITARLIRREALRRAAEELNTTSGLGLESVLARISAEATAEAADRLTNRRPTAQKASPPISLRTR
jgi:hypothetical protein